LDQAVLNLDRAAHSVDHAAKFEEASVACALHDAPVMGSDGGIDQIAAQPPEPRQRTILVGTGEPAVSDYIGNQDRRDFPGLAHGARRPPSRLAQKPVPNLPPRYGTIQRLERDPS